MKNNRVKTVILIIESLLLLRLVMSLKPKYSVVVPVYNDRMNFVSSAKSYGTVSKNLK